MIHKKRIHFKLILLLLGVILLGILLFLPKKEESILPKEERVMINKVLIQIKELVSEFEGSSLALELENKEKKEVNLRRADMLSIITYLKKIKDFEWENRKDEYVSKEEWQNFYDFILPVFDTKKRIQKAEIVILGTKENVLGSEGEVLLEKQILTEQGIYEYEEDELAEHMYQSILVYQTQNKILTYEGEGEQEFVWKNAWIAEAVNQNIKILSDKWLITVPYEKVSGVHREQIADLAFQDGNIKDIIIKNNKINGKLLSVKPDRLEIEGKGSYTRSQDLRIYKLYGNLMEQNAESLTVGLEYTDYVIEDNEIVACLVMQIEALENIRVLLKTSDFAGQYHTEVILCPDTEVILSSGEKSVSKNAGEEIKIRSDSDYFENNRIRITPLVLTGKTKIMSIKRSQGEPVYRGSFEIEKTEEGLLLINELPLEEYLYAVVPSEMPASYPKEALKAQAICARTYAYRNLSNPQIAALGANVDDSVAFQVYNNIVENAETSGAVKETQGQIIRYNDMLAGTYYYSTSCGYGSNIEVWSGNTSNDYPYLQAKKIGDSVSGNQILSAEEVRDENKFKEYIQSTAESDWEVQEGWYRWDYEVAECDTNKLLERIKERYEANPQLIVTRGTDGNYSAEAIEDIGKIKNIQIVKRNPGGIAEELLIEGSKKTYLICKEYNIRYVLSDRKSNVIKQNGEQIQAGTLLPSAYCMLTPTIQKDYVTGYAIRGGGYGHGVGMSQNGAKGMALKGHDSSSIISFFYEGAVIENIYEEGI